MKEHDWTVRILHRPRHSKAVKRLQREVAPRRLRSLSLAVIHVLLRSLLRGKCRVAVSFAMPLLVVLASSQAQGPTNLGERTASRLTSDSSQDQPTFVVGDVHPDASRVYIHVFKTGFGHEHGVEGRIQKGHLHLGRDQNAGQLVFDMPSFRADTEAARRYVGLEGTTDASTRDAVDKNMLGSSVLDVQQYPTAVFDVTSAKRLRDSNGSTGPVYQIKGQFTLHGVTRPVAFQVVAEAKSGWTRLRGNFVIKQTDFGMTPFKKAFGAVGVADPLTIYGDVWLAGQVNITPH